MPEQKQTCCPLCGQENQCALMKGNPIEDCWCFVEKIKTPLSAKGVGAAQESCLCPNCFEKQNRIQKDTHHGSDS